jgi:2-iminobutanoate/2-iminopropanoate deaminase
MRKSKKLFIYDLKLSEKTKESLYLLHQKTSTNMKNIIFSEQAPAPIGPYSQAVAANGMLYISGQIPIDQASGTLVSGDIAKETRQVMENLKHILTAAGISFEEVVKCSIFMTSMLDYAAINTVYDEYFNENTAPAREAVQVSALPKGVNVEISCIAVLK